MRGRTFCHDRDIVTCSKRDVLRGAVHATRKDNLNMRGGRRSSCRSDLCSDSRRCATGVRPTRAVQARRPDPSLD